MLTNRYKDRSIWLVIFIVVIILVSPLPGSAWFDGSHYWGYNDGIKVFSNTSPQTVGDYQVVSDNAGGAFIVWLDIYDLNPTTFTAFLRAQRRNAEGNLVLAGCLVRITTPNQETDLRNFAAVADGSGGVIVTWVGEVNGIAKILAQRIQADGTRPWGNSGIVLSSNLSATDVQPHVCADQIGGAFVGWGSRLVQVKADGSLSPAIDGIEFIPGGNSTLLALISDGTGGFVPALPPSSGHWVAGGVFGAWVDSNNKLFAKRIATGITWDPPVQVTQYQTNGLGIDLALASSASLIITTPVLAGSDYQVRACRYGGNGAPLWGADGVAVVDSSLVGSGYQTSPVVTGDGYGGGIVAWNDDRNGNKDVYAQQVNASGVTQWTANGVYVSQHWLPGGNPALADQYNPKIVSDQSGGAVITYNDRGGWAQDISATRLDDHGKAIWSQWIKWDGKSFADPGIKQQGPKIMFDGSGPQPEGAIILWQESPSPYHQIWAQKVVIDDSPLGNDDCANAKTLSDGQNMIQRYLYRGTNDGSTSCNFAVQPDVWFKYTAKESGLLRVNTCGTNDLGGTDNGMDSVLSIHSACPGNSSNELSCNDNCDTQCAGRDTGLLRDSAVEVSVTKGQTILIRVSMTNDHVPGNFMLSVSLNPKGVSMPWVPLLLLDE